MIYILIALVAVLAGWLAKLSLNIWDNGKRLDAIDEHFTDTILPSLRRHNGMLDDSIRMIEENQALIKKNDDWVAVTITRLDTLEAHAYAPAKPAEPVRKVIQPRTFSEFKQIVENGVNE